MTTTSTKNKKIIKPQDHVLVVGLGQTGFAAVKFFIKSGIKVSVTESVSKEKLDQKTVQWIADRNIFLETGRHTTELFTAVDWIVVSPGIPLNIEPLEAARRKQIPVVGELAVAAQFLKTPAVAVTGTNGKTTVTTLLGDIFKYCGKKVFVGGNIGIPLFDYLCGSQDADVVVIEISSFQLDTAGGPNGFRPQIALLLNISPDHLDRYESYSAYAASKFMIFAAQTSSDTAILNYDDPEIMNRKYLWPKSKCFFFGDQIDGRSGAFLKDKQILLTPDISKIGKKELFDLAQSNLNECPNLQNAMAAILAAKLMGCSKEGINQALREFSPLPHRMTPVAEMNGIRYFDDSKATNVGAVYSSLKSAKQKVVLIAGGRDKGGEYDLLKEIVKEKVKAMILIGEAKRKMADCFRMLTRIEMADSLQDAVHLAHNIAKTGDVVLLSPACSSFDMFADYIERGQVFRDTVMEMKNNLPEQTQPLQSAL